MAQSLISAKSGAREITLTVQIWREDGAYVAYAPELDVSSCGNSLRQSKARLRQAVGLFLEEAARRGTLENILAEAGFERSEEHTSELQSRLHLVCRLLLEKKKKLKNEMTD